MKTSINIEDVDLIKKNVLIDSNLILKDTTDIESAIKLAFNDMDKSDVIFFYEKTIEVTAYYCNELLAALDDKASILERATNHLGKKCDENVITIQKLQNDQTSKMDRAIHFFKNVHPLLNTGHSLNSAYDKLYND